jgi:hypothetical protein
MVSNISLLLDEMNGVANVKMSEHQVESLVLEDDILYETTAEKIMTAIGTILLLLTLAFLWIWYR